jgi:predicted dehydrogenase
LRKAGKLFPQAALYSSAHECLKKERPDIAIIATPPEARLALVQLCIANKVKAIICEKPLAASLSEAEAIARAVKKSGIVFVLNYQRSFAPLFQRVRRDITSGALGEIQHATCYYSNGLYNNGGHAIDALSYLLGEKMTVRWASVNKRAAHPPGDPCVDAVLETKKGTQIHLQSADQNAYGIFDIRILGTRGERAFTDYSLTLTETAARGKSIFKEVHQLDRAHSQTLRGREGNPLIEAIRILIKGERQNGEVQGLAVMRTLESIRYATKKK